MKSINQSIKQLKLFPPWETNCGFAFPFQIIWRLIDFDKYAQQLCWVWGLFPSWSIHGFVLKPTNLCPAWANASENLAWFDLIVCEWYENAWLISFQRQLWVYDCVRRLCKTVVGYATGGVFLSIDTVRRSLCRAVWREEVYIMSLRYKWTWDV